MNIGIKIGLAHLSEDTTVVLDRFLYHNLVFQKAMTDAEFFSDCLRPTLARA